MWKRKKKQEDELSFNINQDQISDYQQNDYADDYAENDLFLIQKQQQKKKPKDKEYYVKGSRLKEEILKYQQTKRKNAQKNNISYEQAKGEISEELGDMIIKICTRFSMHPRFFRLFFQR